MSEVPQMPPQPAQAAPQSLTPPPPPPGPPTVRRRQTPKRSAPPTWGILLILLGLVIIGSVIIAGVLSMQSNRPTGGAESLSVSKLTTFLSPPTVPPDPGVILRNGTPMLTALPNSLGIVGQTYAVIPVAPEQGRWPIPAEGQNMAVWIYGTVVNYVVGLPHDPATEALLASLDSSAKITLTLDNSTRLVFGVPQAQRIASSDLSPMNQDRPGLTIVLLGGNQTDRLTVRARYLPEEGETNDGQQRVDGLTVEVLSSKVVEDTDTSRYFIVEYRVTNNNTSAAQADFFSLPLQDSQGQRYPVNPDISSRGAHGVLQGSIMSGASVEGSAGYLIPRDVTPPITWIFQADPTSSNTARFVLSYQAPTTRPAEPEVNLSSAFVDARRNVIVINGVVRNMGELPLSVTLDDVKLTSSQGSSGMQAATPLLPWNIGEGELQDFELQFSVPEGASSVLLEIVGFTFQIEGLP